MATDEDLCQNITSCIAVAKYDAGFTTHTKGSASDFNVSQGEGYFVYVTQDSSWMG